MGLGYQQNRGHVPCTFSKGRFGPLQFLLSKNHVTLYLTKKRQALGPSGKQPLKLKLVSLSLDPPTSSSIGSAVSCVIGHPRCLSIQPSLTGNSETLTLIILLFPACQHNFLIFFVLLRTNFKLMHFIWKLISCADSALLPLTLLQVRCVSAWCSH